MLRSTVAGIGLLLLTASQGFATCEDEFLPNMQQMISAAESCGESADLLATIGTPSGAISPNRLEKSCKSGNASTGVSSQLSAFNECSRVYVCAVAAYNYAITIADDFNGDCNAAAQEALTKFPVQ